MINIKELSFSFNDVKIFTKINWQIKEQDAWAVLGPSGHGKTSLLKLIAGLLEPQEGCVEFLEKKRISMLFQNNALFDSMTNAENITFPLEVLKKNSKGAVEKYLSAVGLKGIAKLFPDEISGGMQKRLGIARALAIEPDIVLYDDPTAGLDPVTSKQIAKLIREEQKKRKSTIISVTNNIKRAFQLGEKFIFIYNEKIFIFSSHKELENSKELAIYQFIRGLSEGPLSASPY